MRHLRRRSTLASLLVALGACASASPGAEPAAIDSVVIASTAGYDPGNPMWRMVLRPDGRATWDGYQYAVPTGSAAGTVSVERWRSLTRRIEAARMERLQPFYRPRGPIPYHCGYRVVEVFRTGTPPVRVVTAAGPSTLNAVISEADSIASELGWRGAPRWQSDGAAPP